MNSKDPTTPASEDKNTPDQTALASGARGAADYVTGTTLYVDGGMTLFPGFVTGS